MAVSATKDFWIHPNALTITLNYFDDPQLIQTSMLAGSVILAYNKNYIGYDAAHNYREWKLQAFPTQLNDTCAYYVHAELSRDGDTAMIIYSPVKRDIEGRSFIDGAWDNTTSSASWYIYLGEISASVDADGATVERVWTDGLYTGTLATDQQRLEDAQGDWALMFQLNSATGLIDFLRTVSSATFNALTVAKNFIFGGHTFTSVASTEESGDEKKRNDATLPTTGYVQKEIEALDDHFLIKDGDDSQEVGGDVSFGGNVSVAGEHSVGGSQSIGGGQSVGGSQTIEGSQEVKGLQTLHEGFMTPNFNDAGGQVTGAQLTRDGLFSVAGLIANSFTIKELIYNVIRAQGGEYVYSPTVNIERCVYHMKDGRSLSPDDYYAEYTAADFANIDNIALILRDDELTHKGNPLEVGDIVYGYVNQVGESGQHATGGQCLMHVTAINELEVTVELYQIGDRGVVANIPPAEGMTIAQRGTEDSSKTERMTSFYISAESGSVIMLDRVQSPTLSAGNYGASFGKLPTDLLLKVREYFSYIQETDPVVYARYGIFENLLQFDHLGQPIQRENNRGEWVSGEAYYNTVSYYDTVTYEGELWKCVADVTYDAPSSSNDWLLLVAKGKMPNENLLDNTLRFDDNWTLGTSSLYKAEVEDGEAGRKVLHASGRSTSLPFAKQFITGANVEGGVDKVVADEWYTLSFEMKGTSGGVRNVLSSSLINKDEVVYKDGVESSYTAAQFGVAATEDWESHSYTFKTVSEIPTDAYVGLTLTGSSNFYLDKIKLERGKEVTPWTTSVNDGIGKQGADGSSVEIASTTVRYASHDSGTDRPSDDKWSESLPSVADGSYLWTWTEVVYSTGDTTDSYSVSRMGIDGKGIQSAVVTYVQKDNTNTQPKDFPESDWGEFPSSLVDGHWLYTRTVTTYSDGSTSISYSVTQNGQGSYYAGLQEYYAPSASSSGAPTGYPQEGTYPKDVSMSITGLWKVTRPVLSDATPYLWNFSVSYDSKGNRYVVAPVCIGNFAKGIKSIVETYAISAYSKPNGDDRYPTDIESWIIDEAQDAAPTEEKPYQWNKTETTYNDGTKEQFYHVSAVKGENGEDGKDGRGISSVSMEYAVTTTFEQPSLGSDEWKSERPSTIAEGSYLWTKTIVDYTDDSAVDTVGVTVSRIGANGTSVSVNKTEYVESTSATKAPTTGWSTSIPSVDEGNYLWTRITFSDGKVAYSVAKNGKSLTIVSIKYSSVLNSSSQPAESTFTLTSMPTTKQGDYLWTLTTYSDGTKDYSKSYIPNDGVGGKDGLTTQPNLIRNSNFDLHTASGAIADWSNIPVDSIKTAEYNGFNVFVKTSGASMQELKYTLLKDHIYTLSCVMKRHVIDGVSQSIGLAGFLFGIPCVNNNGSYVRQWTKVGGNFTPQSNFADRTDVFIPSSEITTEWSKKTITFRMDETVVMNSLAIYLNTGTYEISQIKLEVGSEATPYQKNQEDLKVEPITVHTETSSMGFTVNAQDSKLLATTSQAFTVYVNRGNTLVPTSEYKVVIPSEMNYTFTTPTVSNGKYTFTATVNKDVAKSSIKPFTIAFKTNSTDATTFGEIVIHPTFAERGIAGPQGESGAILLHRGNYDPKSVYRLSRNDDGSVFGYPIVYLPSEQGLGSYLTLKKDMEAVNADGYPLDTNGNIIDANNTEYWKITPYQEQVFTKFLMANYAQLGSDKGAVFFDRFLFSQYGVNKKGEVMHYTDYDDVMWNEDGTLNGEFTPSLAIDMYSGYVKANKIAETFAEYQYQYDYLLPDGSKRVEDLYANEIDFNQTYNIKYNQRYADVCLLTMPLADDINTEPPFKAQADTAIDGLKSIVLNRADMNWERSYRATVYEEGLSSGFTPFASIVAAAKSSLLLCATPKLFHPYTWYVENGVIYNDELMRKGGGIDVGYFVIDGIMTNFLLIEPGMKAVLRSCRDTDGKLYWYVENGSDFVSMPYTVYVKMPKVYDSDSASLIDVSSNISKWVNVGYEFEGYGAIKRHCFVSKSLYEIYEKLGGSMNIDVVSAGYDVDVLDDWSWEKCITSVSINSNHEDD